jgi:hypothetical protein
VAVEIARADGTMLGRFEFVPTCFQPVSTLRHGSIDVC